MFQEINMRITKHAHARKKERINISASEIKKDIFSNMNTLSHIIGKNLLVRGYEADYVLSTEGDLISIITGIGVDTQNAISTSKNYQRAFKKKLKNSGTKERPNDKWFKHLNNNLLNP